MKTTIETLEKEISKSLKPRFYETCKMYEDSVFVDLSRHTPDAFLRVLNKVKENLEKSPCIGEFEIIYTKNISGAPKDGFYVYVWDNGKERKNVLRTRASAGLEGILLLQKEEEKRWQELVDSFDTETLDIIKEMR